MEQKRKLGKSTAGSTQPIINLGDTSVRPGYVNDKSFTYDYRQVVKDSRRLYQQDAIGGTVINRIVEISATQIKNRRRGKNQKSSLPDEVIAYYNHVAQQIQPFVKQMMLEYLLHGLVIPEYTVKRQMGVRATDKLGRTRYWFPEYLYCRNIDNIELTKLPGNAGRMIFLKIPQDEIKLIKERGGKDETTKALYQYYVDNFPEYVAAINKGETKFQLKDVLPIYRKLTSYNVYPLPYLVNAIAPMTDKENLKRMDRSITSRVIEAVRQISVGNDEFPADDEDLKAEQASFIAFGNSGEKVFNYFTNHTVKITWSYPPFEALLSDSKYTQPNLEIFMALGFPRLWVTGETEKSNSADNALAIIGPIATINDIRSEILLWLKQFYEKLAELNNFDRVPEPYFTRIDMSDVANLIQYAQAFFEAKAISKETMSEFYNREWEDEQAQIEAEQKISPEPQLEQVNNNANTPTTENGQPATETGNGLQQKNTTNQGNNNTLN